MNETKDNFNKLIKQNEELVKVLQNIVNGCVHPEIAFRAVMVDLKPIRNAIKKNQEVLNE